MSTRRSKTDRDFATGKLRSIIIPELRLNVWNRSNIDGASWGAQITNKKTNRTFVKIYRKSKKEAIGAAFYDLYRYFNNKNLDQVKEELEAKIPQQKTKG